MDHQGQMRTISVPAAGKLLGIGRNTAYRAAKNGELPVLQFGKRMVVPLAALNRKLEIATVTNNV
jgi:excisionase family DNA binding protein